MATRTGLGDGEAIDQIRDGHYVLLTTFKRDGTGVPTPVWLVPVDTPAGRGIRVWTGRSSGKVKRIRVGAHVQIASCSRSGVPQGETIDAEARLLDEGGTRETIDALRERYGLLGKIFTRKVKDDIGDSVAIEVTPATTEN